MRLVTLLIAVGIVLGVQGNVLADTWCNSSFEPYPASCHSTAIYCDSFDASLCVTDPACPPPPPMPCILNEWSWKEVRIHYPRTSQINDNGSMTGVELKPDEYQPVLASPFLGLRHPNGALGQATVDLTSDIEYTFGAGVDTVMGTDLHPLVLQYTMSGGIQDACHIQWDIAVMDLFLDDGSTGYGIENTRRPQMDFIMVGAEEDPVNYPGCLSCYAACPGPEFGPHNAWPHVCQSYEPRTGQAHANCPPLQTNIRSSIAVGVNALLDNNPCHCETPSNQKPTNGHLSFYDGLKWRILDPGDLPDNPRPGPEGETLVWETTEPGFYLVPGRKINFVKLTIKSETADIELYCKRTPVGPYPEEAAIWSKVSGIKLMYTGAFNKMHLGNSIGCRMDSNGNCIGNRTSIKTSYDSCKDDTPKGVWGHRGITWDNLALHGGVPGGILTGACCYGNGECVDDVSSEDCDALNGRYDGKGSVCGDVLCCPDPFADADKDNDVDQADFGTWQTCFSGDGNTHPYSEVCECFDRNDADGSQGGDGDVDGNDFDRFNACWSGPTVPSVTSCDGGL